MKAILQRGREWLWPRRADTPPLTLGQRRIYVLPTTAGMLYASTLALMLVGSINYNLSLGYGLTFLLAGLGVVAIVHSFRNLTGLEIRPGRHTPGFAGDHVHFGVILETRRPRPGLQLQLAGGGVSQHALYESTSVQLAVPALQRGWQTMPRLTLATTWPLGLVRAWSYARFEEHCLVYPSPAPKAPPWQNTGGHGRQHSNEPDDFFGLRAHRTTDLLQHVAWKASARLESGLLSKHFAAEQGESLWFDLAQAPGATLEDKLAVLTRWVLDAHAAQQHYGLRLGSQRIGPASGSDHLHACLQALALHV